MSSHSSLISRDIAQSTKIEGGQSKNQLKYKLKKPTRRTHHACYQCALVSHAWASHAVIAAHGRSCLPAPARQLDEQVRHAQSGTLVYARTWCGHGAGMV